MAKYRRAAKNPWLLMNRKKRVAVLISGNGSNLQALIDAARETNYPAEIKLVIADQENAYGLTRAANAGIEGIAIKRDDFSTRSGFEEEINKRLLEKEIEIICLAGFMRVLSAEFVEKWRGRMINIHPSLLPKYKGLNTHQRALEAGEKEAGCSVHFVETEIDSGAIIMQKSVPILPEDTAESLAARVLSAEHQIYPQALKALCSRNL